MPGDVALGEAGDTLRTLLGSCVSVVLTDPRRTVGAMCHIVHVGRTNPEDPHDTAYGEAAMYTLFDLLLERGIQPHLCEAYVYGGGNMFPELFRQHHVGQGNAAWVLRFLQEHGIRVLEQQLGGAVYRKVSWTVGPGAPTVLATAPELGVGHGH